MASTLAPTALAGVVLDLPGDWDDWIRMIKATAMDSSVWTHMDYLLEKEPAKLVEPTEPTAPEMATGATAATTESTNLARYRIQRDEYKSRYAKYEKKDHAITEMKKLIRKTVARRNLIHMNDSTTAYQMLKALQVRLAPTDRARKIELTKQYNSLLKAPKTQGIDAWLQRWEKIYADAVNIKLADVQDEKPLYDFLTALSDRDPMFASVQENSFEEKLYAKTPLPSMYELLERYRNHMRVHRASTTTDTHNAFASYQGETLKEESTKVTESQKASTRGTTTKATKPCLCGMTHLFKECFYLMEHLRKPNWTPKADLEKKVQLKLKDNERLRGIVERIRQSSLKTQNKGEEKYDKSSKPADDTKDGPVASFAVGGTSFKLENCWILDSGADVHICNEQSRFVFDRIASDDSILFSGKTIYQIEAYGTVIITVQSPTGPIQIKLLNVAYIPGFFTNLVALRRLTEKGVHWDTEKERLHTRGKTFCYTQNVDDHWVLEYNSPTKQLTGSAFATSREPRSPKEATAVQWHAVMGHPGKDALDQLQGAVNGAEVTGQGPTTIECETCSVSKARELISRRTEKEDPAEAPLARIAYDLIEMTTAYNGHKWISHFSDYYTSMDFVYTHHRKGQSVGIVSQFINMVKTRYSRNINSIRYLRTDGETSLGKKFDALIAEKGITAERSSPYTPSQNGAAERSGGVIIIKARCLRIAASLPANMWPEIVKTTGYLNNRTPKRKLQWITPIQSLTTRKPSLSHLHVYGCRAYPLRYKIPKTQKLEPRAHIGYLVGYDSSNIYRVWIPSQDRVVRIRDVTFNEKLFYSPQELDLGHILREEIDQAVEILNFPSIPSQKRITELDSDTDDEEEMILTEDVEEEDEEDSEPSKPAKVEVRQTFTPDPTPESSIPTIEAPSEGDDEEESISTSSEPRTQLTAAFNPENILPEGTKRQRKPKRIAHAVSLARNSQLEGFHSAFATGIETSKQRSYHRDSLPAEPRSWKQMLRHRQAAEFKIAAEKEIKALTSRGTFKYVPRDSVQTPPLPLIWVFKYKFDSDGYLDKFKARLCVRGDLQRTEQDTYAATLAARTFRALMAIAAAFNLEIFQYDAVNAFLNSKLNEEIFCQCPEGFERHGKCWTLIRALYGLKQSPLLWYKDLTSALEDLGLQAVPGVNCLFTNSYLSLFFFVDDIVVLCATRNLDKLKAFETALFARFEMRNLGELHWFLGIRVMRDRDARKVWLCQDAYIDKIASKFNRDLAKSKPKTPLPLQELVPNDGEATESQINHYQQRVGSINFTAVMSRPDVAFAVSKLAQFLTNPSPEHSSVADRVISYLYCTKTLAIEFTVNKEMEILVCWSDAAFADDTETRRSSDGYLFKLYAGAIDWRAAKQRTVTTSSTEAELLSLSGAARETIWWTRFFKAIDFDTEQNVTIGCDNLMAIRLMIKEGQKLDTKLRHVDIHRHWLRQEVQRGAIKLRYVKTEEMPADGMTKSLPSQKHELFIKQLGLVNIETKLGPNRQAGADPEN